MFLLLFLFAIFFAFLFVLFILVHFIKRPKQTSIFIWVINMISMGVVSSIPFLAIETALIKKNHSADPFARRVPCSRSSCILEHTRTLGFLANSLPQLPFPSSHQKLH
jgi:hypothetical protein